MNNIRMTLQGNAADKPQLWENGTRPFARVNVASTARIRQGEEWVDGDTQWVQVKAWGKLAENMAASIRKGDAVMVTGTFRHEEYTNDEGVVYKTAAVHATGVGFDLKRTCAMAVTRRADETEERAEETEGRAEEAEAPSGQERTWPEVAEPPSEAEAVSPQGAPF